MVLELSGTQTRLGFGSIPGSLSGSILGTNFPEIPVVNKGEGGVPTPVPIFR